MASIISADNGSISGSAGLKSAADSSGILQLQTGANINAFQIDASQYPSATVNGLGKGAIPAEQLYRLNSAFVGANSTAAQNWLGVGVTLVGSTVYQFEGLLAMTKTTGTTSNSISLLFGGTASLNNIIYSAMWAFDATSFQTYVNSNNFAIVQVSTASAPTQTSTTAVTFYRCMIKGTISINAGGTFIPQYSLSAAPGGAYTTAIGSYFKISPLAASGANTNIGSWA